MSPRVHVLTAIIISLFITVTIATDVTTNPKVDITENGSAFPGFILALFGIACVSLCWTEDKRHPEPFKAALVLTTAAGGLLLLTVFMLTGLLEEFGLSFSGSNRGWFAVAVMVVEVCAFVYYEYLSVDNYNNPVIVSY